MFQTKYPFAAWLLSLYYGAEDPAIALDQEVATREAVRFKSVFLDDEHK